jgi:hypothetical protein
MQFGGSKPQDIELLLKPEATIYMRQVGLDVHTKKSISSPVSLIFEGDKKIIIKLQNKNENIVSIKKDAIEAIKLK